ncbi:MAG: lysophospholipase, partial [Clostridia bacterium]|nr:lysophospholipase [Clostridia bacterium]
WEKFQAVKEYAKVAKKIAEDYNLTFVPLQAKFDEAEKKFGGDYYTFDGVHPLAAGAKMIADEWLKAFKENIDK